MWILSNQIYKIQEHVLVSFFSKSFSVHEHKNRVHNIILKDWRRKKEYERVRERERDNIKKG